MSKKDIIGICVLCGQEKKLTFEHIPPHAAFNNRPASVVTGDKFVRFMTGEQVKGKIQQKGMGRYSLCEECNSKTGAWYGDFYQKVAKDTAYILYQKPIAHGEWITFSTDKFRPLEFVKQICSFFCSTVQPEFIKQLGFEKFILDRESNDIDTSKFDLRIYLTPITVKNMATGYNVQFVNWQTRGVAEVVTHPFGFMLNFNPEIPLEVGTSLLPFFKLEYGKEHHVDIGIQCLEKHEQPLTCMFKSLPKNEQK